MATGKQISANRKNAARSTGPKTPRGKQVVRWNSLKHGLLAREVVIDTGEGEENVEEFKTLLGQLEADLAPDGPLEHILVERIAVCYWRLRRVIRYETGKIRRRLDCASWRAAVGQAEQFAFDKKFAGLGDSGEKFMKSTMGLDYLISVLQTVEESVAEVGYLDEWAKDRLFETFGTDKKGIAAECLLFSMMATEGVAKAAEDPDRFGSPPSPDVCKQLILDTLREHRERLTQLRDVMSENEGLHRDAMVRGLSLPSKESVDKIIRYETTIERQLYRAVSQLERLQRRRLGEPVPPPISVDVATGK